MERRPSRLARAVVLAAALLAGRAAETHAQPGPPVCATDELPGLAGLHARARRDSQGTGTGTPPGGLLPGPAADYDRVVRAVLGALTDAGPDAPPPGGVGRPSAGVPCPPDVRRRDDLAWRMAAAGYSAREIADVLGGHLTIGDLDDARRRLMGGQPRALVAAFLEARWREPAAVAPPRPPDGPVVARRDVDLGALEADLASLARPHGVDAGLVRAVVAAESAGNPAAVSPVGAIGLMQLMPATAAALGVDPWTPRDNLRGGITNLASLLRDFDGDTRLALIAYNAGPSHARDVRAGRAVAYRETRRYLDAIAARYPLP